MENFNNSINETMKQFCEVGVSSGTNDIGIHVYRAYCCQTPAYFMQVLALLASKDGVTGAASALIKNAVADKYVNARNRFALIGNDITGGMNHPHWTETYYLIATNDFK